MPLRDATTTQVLTWQDNIPAPMSEPCSAFLSDHWEMATLLAFVHLLAFEKDAANQQRARDVLKLEISTSEKAAILHDIVAHHGAAGALLTRHGLLFEMMLCRAVDNYMCYITGLLTLIFTHKPEALRSSEEITVDEILQHSDMRDVVNYLADRKVLKLGFKGMRELAKELEKRPGLVLLEDKADLENAIRIVEFRNLIAHNRAIINRLFLSRVPDFSGQVGDRLPLNQTGVLADLDFLACSVCDIERRGAAKFGFPQAVTGEEHQKRFKELTQVLDLFDKEALLAPMLPSPESSQPDN